MIFRAINGTLPFNIVLLFLLPGTISALTVGVTHAAGRMGVSVLGQLRENNPDLKIVAIVRDSEEEARLNLDLCGAVLRGGVMSPLRSLENDLKITCKVVPPEDPKEMELLTAAFEGCAQVVLLSAAHADFGTPPDSCLMTGQEFLAQGHEALESAMTNSEPVTVRVPPLENARASRRLAFEIQAAKSAQPERIVLRSSMGIDALIKGSSSDAVVRMGGEAALASNRVAEESLLNNLQSSSKATILRLGALVDGAGGVPLKFYSEEEEAERHAENGMEPPLVSRNDAARIITALVLSDDGLGFEGKQKERQIITASWEPRWGTSSAGTEEVILLAKKQDVVADVMEKARAV